MPEVPKAVIPRGKLPKAILFGASTLGAQAVQALAGRYNIIGFVDNARAKWNTQWAGLPVEGPDRLRELSDTEIIVTSAFHVEISRQLTSMGLAEHSVFAWEPSVRRRDSAAEADPFETLYQKMHKLRGSFIQTLNLIHRVGLRPGTVIDVGVAFGTPGLAEAFPGARLLMVEPLEEFRPHMERIAAAHGAARFVVAAAGDTDGVTRIAVSPDKTTSTLGDHVLTGAEVSERQVPLTRLDTLCEREQMQGPFVIKIDVQGHELEVVAGSSRILAHTEVFVLETNLFSWIHGIPELATVVATMKSLGFVAYDIVGGHNRPLDLARAQTDVVFVREDGLLRRDQRWATPEQLSLFLERKRRNPLYQGLMVGT